MPSSEAAARVSSHGERNATATIRTGDRERHSRPNEPLEKHGRACQFRRGIPILRNGALKREGKFK